MGLFGKKKAAPTSAATTSGGAAFMRLLSEEHAKGMLDLKRMGFGVYAYGRYVTESTASPSVVGMSGYAVSPNGTVYELVVRVGVDGSPVHTLKAA